MGFVFAIVFLAYLGLLLFAWFFAERLIFPAPKAMYTDTDFEMLRLRCTTGETVRAIWLPNAEARQTLLYCHGNREDLGYIYPRMQEFQRRGFAVFAIEYPGYGLSEGRPSEKNALAAADAAYTYLRETLNVPPEALVVYGFSLGSGIATDLAARKPVAGLIVEGAFYSTFRVVTCWGITPFDRLVSGQKIPYIRCPLLLFHGERDITVPAREGRRLFRAAVEPKEAVWVPKAGHCNVADVLGETYWEKIETFCAKLEPGTQPA